jgi:ubiquinone biosynthesis protein UbiJ
MTFEEMQQIVQGLLENQQGIQRDVQGLLSVQRDLQQGQMRLQYNLDELALLTSRTTRGLNRLLGYNIDQETEITTVREDVERLKSRVDNLEQNQ